MTLEELQEELALVKARMSELEAELLTHSHPSEAVLDVERALDIHASIYHAKEKQAILFVEAIDQLKKHSHPSEAVNVHEMVMQGHDAHITLYHSPMEPEEKPKPLNPSRESDAGEI